MQQQKRMVASVILVAILLIALTSPVWAQSATRFANLIVTATLNVAGTSTLTGAVTTGGDLTVGDDATITDDLAVTSDLAVTGDAAVGSDLKLSAQTAITLTSDATLTPTGSYQPIQAAGNIGFGAITVGAAGTLLTIVNISNTTITITDTGTLKLSGNAALAQYDVIQLMSDGTNWLQIAPEGDN